MKRSLFIALAATLYLLVSCMAEIDQTANDAQSSAHGPNVVFQALTEGPASPETKVYADENMKVLWNADDRISIFNMTTYNYQYAFTGDDGDTAGDFEEMSTSGFITGQPVDYVYAAYPYSKSNKLSNSGVFTMVLPSEQAYKEHSFGIGANSMVAITDGSFLAFKNVGGYLSLRLYGDNVSVSKITIQGNNGEKIAGKGSIDIPFGGTPTVTMDAVATDAISIVCDPAVKIGDTSDNYTDFWFVIPPVTFEKGFTITVTDDMGGVFEKSTSKSFTVSRNTLDWMSALKVVPNYDNVKVQFEDANFKAYCVKNFDRDGDGEISYAEALLVTEITCYWKSIQSLSGIEYFSNLTYLYCYSNQLTSLDVSKNTALTYLDCYSNQLTSLDVCNNTALTELYCDSNQLTSLDVSNNTALIRMKCGYNQLTSLDVSSNTALNYLDCAGNQLTSLDVSNNTALATLRCSSNQLTSLDVSNNTALTQMECGYNQLTSLDVSSNTALTGLGCYSNQLTSLNVSNNTALTYLYCDSNQLTSLDVSNNTALTGLYCGSNQLTSLGISNNTALTGLDCSYNQLTKLDVSSNIALYYMDCAGNQLTSVDVSNITSLATLRCSSNQLTSLDVRSNTALTVLQCSSNQLTNVDVSNNTALTDLYCGNNPLNTIFVNECQQFETLQKPDDAEMVTVYPIEETLNHLYSGTTEFIDAVNSVNACGMSKNDSVRLVESIACFARARKELHPHHLQSYDPETYDLFTYCKGIDASGQPILASVKFSELSYNQLSHHQYDYIVDDSGNLVCQNCFKSITTQLFNSVIGSHFFDDSLVQPITDSETEFNAENYRAFCGAYRYVVNPASIIPLN